MPELNRPLKVFLSYASQDKPFVKELSRRLVGEGWIDTWQDEKSILPGQDWRVKIEEAVEDADVVIICLSSHSVTKEGYVQKELRYAREIALEKPEDTIFLIPLRLDECEVPRGLRFYQWVDYFGEKRISSHKALVASLRLRYEQKIKSEEAGFLRKEKTILELSEKTVHNEGGKISLRAKQEEQNSGRNSFQLKPFLRIGYVFGVFVVLVLGGLFVVAKFNSLISTVVPTFPPNVLNTLESTIIPIATNVTPSYTVTSTYTVTPILTPFPTVQPFGGGVLVFATGDLGKQDLYSIRGNGLDLTRLTPESGYIGYRWSGCDCSGVKRISGYDYVMGLSPDQKFLYYYYAPLGERKLRVINMFTLETIIDVFAPYGSALAWSQDGDKVAYTEYVEKDIEYIKVVDSHGQNPIEVGEGHRIDNIGWTQDGHSLFYTDHICLNGSITYNVDAYEYPVCDNYLHVADPAVQGDKVVYSILLHSGIFFEVSAVASNTAPQIAIPTPNKVVIFDYLSHQEIRSVSYPAVLQGYDILKQPYWSEDGTLLFRVNNPYTKNKEIYELLNGEFSILTDEERFQASNILEPLSREYSPLIYIGRNNNEQEVYIRDVNALNSPEVIGQVISIKEIVQNLGMSGFEFSKVSWSPDRNELALILSRDEEQSTILIYSLLNRKVRKLIDNIEDYSSVSWSPDGNYLAFISKPVRSSSPSLYIVDHSGENIVKLADTSQKDLGGLFWVPSH